MSSRTQTVVIHIITTCDPGRIDSLVEANCWFYSGKTRERRASSGSEWRMQPMQSCRIRAGQAATSSKRHKACRVNKCGFKTSAKPNPFCAPGYLNPPCHRRAKLRTREEKLSCHVVERSRQDRWKTSSLPKGNACWANSKKNALITILVRQPCAASRRPGRHCRQTRVIRTLLEKDGPLELSS